MKRILNDGTSFEVLEILGGAGWEKRGRALRTQRASKAIQRDSTCTLSAVVFLESG